MKRTFLTLGLILIINLSACGQVAWKEYKSHNFKIEFYQNPEYSADTSYLDNYPLITHFWQVNIADTVHENVYYSISLSSFPPDYIHSDSLYYLIEGFINSTQNSILEDDSFTMLSSTLTERHGFPGKVFKWKSNSSNKFLEFQVFLVESTLFQLSVVSREGENHNIFINKYFDSFEILNTPQGGYSVPQVTFARTFEVDFPKEPKNEIKTMDSEYGKLALDIQTYEPTGQEVNLLYIAGETKYPNQVTDPNDLYALNSFYKKSIDATITSVNGELISIHDIYYDGKLGKEFKCYFSSGKVLMVYRVFYIGNSMYITGVMTSPDKDKNKEMNKFLDSFKTKK